ncbi:hypothetical protein cypCar_00005056 [Cyprinus carpio]|nr:hypothetical protein cypCar_00005056 [Cyprinus carpio]
MHARWNREETKADIRSVCREGQCGFTVQCVKGLSAGYGTEFVQRGWVGQNWGQLEVTLSQPTRTANGTPWGHELGNQNSLEPLTDKYYKNILKSTRRPLLGATAVDSGKRVGSSGLSGVPEEKRSLITLKSKMTMDEDPEVLVKDTHLCIDNNVSEGLEGDFIPSVTLTQPSIKLGWLLREVQGGWLRQRRFWFVLTTDSLDYYSGPERDARRQGTLVLTSLCSVLWPDKHTYKQTDMAGKGYMSIREEAVRLFNCLQQLESAREPIPLIQGILQTCLDLRPLRDELYCQLIKQTSVTNSHVQTQTQTQPNPQLRYWQLLTCMSCTFLPSCSILRYLRFHLKRVQSLSVDPEVESYASFIAQALEKTRGRECVPSWEEIQGLMGRQEILCTVHYPGPGCCQIPITSHTTANEHASNKNQTDVVRQMAERLGLQDSRNTFALFEQNSCWEKAIGGSTIIADVITRFENLSAKDPDSDCQCRLCFKLYCLLDTDSISTDNIEYLFLVMRWWFVGNCQPVRMTFFPWQH